MIMCMCVAGVKECCVVWMRQSACRLLLRVLSAPGAWQQQSALQEAAIQQLSSACFMVVVLFRVLLSKPWLLSE